jgi:ABC-type proline/glycine betaine transport system ATPase subunit
VFFRTQEESLYPKQDVWGNADLVPYRDAREEIVARATERLGELPVPQRQMYLKKLASELSGLADGLTPLR